MADVLVNASTAVNDKNSVYNVMRSTGFKEAPFYASLGKAVAFKGAPAGGHKWYHRQGPTLGGNVNAYGEGSRRADATTFTSSELSNQLQIFKKTSGITNSEDAAMSDVEIGSKLAEQKMLNKRQMLFDINAALLGSAAPTVGVDTDGNVKRTLAGIGHYSTINTLTGAFSIDIVKDGFKQQYLNGVTEQRNLLVSPDIKDIIDDYFETMKRVGVEEKSIFKNVSLIGDIGWAKNVQIITDPHLAAGTMIAYAPSLINPVLLRAVKDRACSSPEYDIKAEEDVHELSLQVLDPFAAIIWTGVTA